MARIRPLPALMVLLVAACGSGSVFVAGLDERYVAEEFVARRWLSAIQDGAATRDEVIRLLGPPTQTFQGDEIFVYRLILAEPEVSVEQYRLSAGIDFPYTPAVRKDPSAQYGERIAALNERRKRLAEQGTPIVLGPGDDHARHLQILGREAEYSLVLVFDQRGVLRTHRLLRVRP